MKQEEINTNQQLMKIEDEVIELEATEAKGNYINFSFTYSINPVDFHIAFKELQTKYTNTNTKTERSPNEKNTK